MNLIPNDDNDYIRDCYPNFNNNLVLPRHRWYAFKEGFSSQLVQRAIKETRSDQKKEKLTVLDPFAGSGTTPLTALQLDCDTIGLEVNPFMEFVTRTKCLQLTSYNHIKDDFLSILRKGSALSKSPLEGVSTFSKKNNSKKWLFNTNVLRQFESLNKEISNSEYRNYFKLSLMSAMMECCNAEKDGKCLRYKDNWQEANFNEEILKEKFINKTNNIIEDLISTKRFNSKLKIIQGSALTSIKNIKNNAINLIVFSPPYLNTFDYSDIYRPELFLGGFIKNNIELRELRKQTLRSHVQVNWETNDVPESIWAKEIANRVEASGANLWNKNIPKMINNYFFDMELLFKELFRVSSKNAQIWFVVGTSAYAGIEIPVDLILTDLAANAGWNPVSVNVLRRLRTSSQCSNEEVRKVRLRESLIICKKGDLK